ncbi:Hypothetical predicted protein [Mytilus galloprovincialis]|uniref:Uncharacterized protein n=2 Tax=Mytilus galloprovincialis TaxID=29158 RepID=A0A8B6FY40_MYTGA|nr:Hypothetical predicted protein [Mytilus galloprovincialis]
MTTISERNIFQIIGIIYSIKIQTVSAQCSLQTLCLEMKIVVIGCGTVAVAAIIGFVFIACRGSKRSEPPPKKHQPTVRKSKIKSVVVYDEIDESPINAKQKNKEDNRYRYEEVVIKRSSGLNYDDLVHRRRKSKIPTPRGLFKKKRRVQVLKSQITAKDNVYSVDILESEHDNEPISDKKDVEKQVVIELEQFDGETKTQDIIISETNDTKCSFVENALSENTIKTNGDCAISSEISNTETSSTDSEKVQIEENKLDKLTIESNKVIGNQKDKNDSCEILNTETSSIDSEKLQINENKLDKLTIESFKLNGNQNDKNDSCETDNALRETDSKMNNTATRTREVLTKLSNETSETSNYDNSLKFLKDRTKGKPPKVHDKPSKNTKNNITGSSHNQMKPFTQQDNESEKITEKKKDPIDQVDDRIEYINLRLK